jgi:hypothetical protein
MSGESQQRQPLLGNSSANMPTARQWPSSHHVITATEMHATIKLLEEVFSAWSVPRLYNKGQLQSQDSSLPFIKGGTMKEEKKNKSLDTEQIYGHGSQWGSVPRVTVLAGCQQ